VLARPSARRLPRLIMFRAILLLGIPLVVLQVSATMAADSPYPLESADTSSPQGTLRSFLAAMHDAYEIARREGRSYQSGAERAATRNRALRCLDLSELAPAVKTSLAKEAGLCLKEVLDRIELPPESDWPDSNDVAEKELTKWTIPHTDISIIKVKEGLREGEFLFSSDTVDRATEFYEVVKGREYIKRETTTPGFYRVFLSEPGWMIPSGWIPSWAHTRCFGQAVWQWIGLALTLLVALGVMITIYLVGQRRVRKLRSNLTRYLTTLFFPITAMLVPLAAHYFVVQQLQIYGYLVVTMSFVLHLVFLFALMIVVISAGTRLAELIIATPWVQPAGLDAQLVRLTCRLLSIVGAAVVLLEGGRQLGIPLTTLLAGAGVSGLALALAAQDSLKNILGSMMIMLDKPFRVGERIVVRGYDGIVEDIGLRSTKIRLLTGHLVSIPNEEMDRVEIENIGRRPFIRRAVTIELPSDTPSVKILRALDILRTILENHEGMAEDLPPRVFLRDINESSVGIFMVYWYHPPKYWDFLAFSERVTLEMSEQFESEGISFAAPALTVHIPPDENTHEQR
jgi:MscS family membrane protein